MTYYDSYITRITAYGDNSRDAQIDASVAAVNSLFANNPSYTTITINSTSTEVILLDGKDSTHKFLLFLPSSTISIGEIVTINSQYWLVTDFVSSPISPKASIELCNDTLYWQDSNGVVQSSHCVTTRSLLTKMDIKESQYNISLLEGEMNCFVPNNVLNETIKPDQRFYLGNYIYYVGGIDDISNIGIIRFSMKTTTIKENDNPTLRICDYVSDTYSIIINNGSTLSSEINQDIQLSVDVFFGDVLITNPVITYTTTDDEVATVSSTGLISTIKVGTTVVTATGYGVSDSINITVTDEIVVDNYVLVISGNDELGYAETYAYTPVVSNNGNPVIDQTITWSLTSGSSYASIISSDSDSCVLQNVDIGSVVLRAEFTIDAVVVYGTKTITCKGMW